MLRLIQKCAEFLPQDRITDKRVGHNFSNIARRMDGDIDDLIDELSQQDEADRLARLEETGG